MEIVQRATLGSTQLQHLWSAPIVQLESTTTMHHQYRARRAPSDTTPLHSPPHVHSVSLVRTMTTALLRLSVLSAHQAHTPRLVHREPMDVLLVLSVSMTTTVNRATVPRHHA